jgi:tripartite-type tricarboxylate transporter receptor subunit TctC
MPGLGSRLRGNEWYKSILRPMRVPFSKRVLRYPSAAFVALCVLLVANAHAQDYPTRPVRLIVAFTAGGTADRTARLIAAKMESALGRPIAVENKPGGNGAVAAQYVAQSEPDGYTLFFTTAGAVAISPAFHSDLNYDPIRDFAPVGEAAINSPMLVVNGEMKINSARELATLARKKPGTITIGITGRGAMSDLALQLFEADAGIQLQSVPYRGAAQAITDVLGGRLDGLVGDIPTVMGQVRAGKLKALGTSSKDRSDIFPDVPTFVEQGFAGAIGDNWAGVLAPAGTPAPVIAKFNAAMVAALKAPDLRAQLRASGTTPAPSSPAQFDTYMREEIARWRAVIRDKGLTGE